MARAVSGSGCERIEREKDPSLFAAARERLSRRVRCFSSSFIFLIGVGVTSAPAS